MRGGVEFGHMFLIEVLSWIQYSFRLSMAPVTRDRALTLVTLHLKCASSTFCLGVRAATSGPRPYEIMLSYMLIELCIETISSIFAVMLWHETAVSEDSAQYPRSPRHSLCRDIAAS